MEGNTENSKEGTKTHRTHNIHLYPQPRKERPHRRRRVRHLRARAEEEDLCRKLLAFVFLFFISFSFPSLRRYAFLCFGGSEWKSEREEKEREGGIARKR
jgi:hypothetical protein